MQRQQFVKIASLRTTSECFEELFSAFIHVDLGAAVRGKRQRVSVVFRVFDGFFAGERDGVGSCF